MRRPLRPRRPHVARLHTTLALLVPVLLVGCMMLFELAQLGLTIHAGGTALDRTLASWSAPSAQVPAADALPGAFAASMSEALEGRLPPSAIAVQVRQFGGDAGARAMRSLTVDIRQPYATPLPALLGLGDVFRYRYKRFMGHPAGVTLEDPGGADLCCLLPRQWGPAAWLAPARAAVWALGVLAFGLLAWYAGVGRLWVALLFAGLTALAGSLAGAFVVVTTLAGGLLALLRLPYAWGIGLGVLWWALH